MTRIISHPATLLFCLLLLATVVAPHPAAADWTLRALGAYGEASGSTTVTPDVGESIEVSGDELTGWGLGIDYRFSDRLGLGLTLVDSEVDTSAAARIDELRDADTFDIGLTAWSLALDVDLLPARELDLLVAPLLLWIDYGDPTVDFSRLGVSGRFELDDEVTWGLRLRADIPFGRFVLSTGLEYWDATAEVTNADIDLDIAIDPWIFTVGGGYRF